MEKKLDTQRSVVVGIGLASTIERSSFRYSSESDLVLKSSIGDEMNNNATTTKTRKSSIKDSESSSSNTQTTVSSNSEEIPSLINDDDDDVNNDDVFDESGENSSNRSEENRKRQLEKFNILKEVLSSEKKYLNDLREIVEGYYEEIKKFSTDEFVYHIFSNIKDIYEFTKSFYLLLESSTDDEVGIANCFIKKHKVFLRLYSTYCQNYRIAYNSTEKLESENNIAKIIQKIRLKYGHCLKMTTYLQLPVLRITKYHLLLQRYLNLLQVNSAAYNQVLEALELMKHVNDSINQEMPADDDNYSNSATANATNRSNSIAGSSTSTSHTSIVNINNFIKLFGQILKQGNLLLVQSKKVHYVILFQKMLIIRKADSPNKIMHSISNENLALLPTSCKVKTRSFTVIDYSQPKDGAMWQIVFKAKTDEEKKSWQSSILSCMLNGYSKNKISDRIKTNINNVAASASLGNAHQINNATSNAVAASNLLVVPNNRSAHDIIREKLANFRRLTEFRHSLRTSESLKETTTSSLGNIRQQFEDAFRRRLSNPVTASSQSAAATSSSSSKIVGKLLDKTLTLGTFTKETLASPMMKFRRNNQLARINELDYSSTKDSPTNNRQRHHTASASSSLARSSTATPVTSTKSDSISKKQHLLQHPPSPPPPVPKQQQIKTRSDSYNAIVATSPDPKPVESARLHHSIVMPLDYLNRSYDNVQMVDDDDDDEMMMVNDEEVEKRETERRFIQYRSIISEMNRAFEEKYGTRKCNGDDNDEEEKKNDEFENLKKMDVKEPETPAKPALALTDNNNDITNKNNENRAATNTNRSSKSSINSSEEGYYSNHDSSESSCSNSTLIENTTTTESSSSSSSSPSSISSSGSKPTSFSPPQTPDTLKEPVEEETRTISPFPVVKSQQPVVKIVSSLPPVPPSSSTSPLFKLEKISIKKIDFGEAIDSRKELEITDLLNQTATLTVNLSKPPQPPPNSHGLRITPSRSCSRNDETDSKHRDTSQHRSDQSSKPNLTTSTMTKTKPNLSTYSFNLKSSLSSGLNSTTLHASNSEYEIGRKLHSFKISASPSSNTSSNGETTITTSRAAKNASKLSLNNANLTLGDKTTAKTRTSSSNNLDHVSFVNVKELINKFECKLLDNVL